MLTKHQIFSANDTRIETVSVPEWGGDVGIRVISGAARDQLDMFLAGIVDSRGNVVNVAGLRAKVCVLACCDAEGEPIFTEKDIPALQAKSSLALDRVTQAAMKLNGLGKAAVEGARDDFFDAPKSDSGSV